MAKKKKYRNSKYQDEIQQLSQKAKSRAFGVIYSRTLIVMLLILLQIGFMSYTLSYVNKYSPYVNGLVTVISAIAVIYIYNDDGNPAFKMTWLLFIMLFPVVGTGFYLYTKVEIEKKYIGKRLMDLRLKTEPFMKQNPEVAKSIQGRRDTHMKLSRYLYRNAGYPTLANSKAKYFPLGDNKFPALLNELNKAEKFIFMEYFIVADGLVWDTILRVLQKKVQAGVEVRFLYDGMNSATNLPYDYPEQLEKLGIKCKQFAPIRPILSTSQNNRDHRKICVVDGRVAFTGGVNLADEYINMKERFGHWKDTAIMIEGDAVQSFTMMFLQMWNTEDRVSENYSKYLTPKKEGIDPELGFMIPYGDGPYDEEDVGQEVYLHILNHAKQYVHIMTPYLIVDYEMRNALVRAAKAGTDVKIIMPHIPDKPYAFHLAKTYYRELIQSGVQIYEYTPGFMHAKVFVSDDNVSVVGTINLDFRSLFHHFECGVFIYDNPVVYDIEEDFLATLEKCQKISLVDLQNRSVFSKIYGQLLRLIAPLM